MSDDSAPAARPTTGTSLRGWLSELLFPTLIDGPLAPLVTRLGGRSTVDDPILGRASGLPAVETLLEQARQWLTGRRAAYAQVALVVGTDRDAAEGSLTLAGAGESDPDIVLPVAVVAERRRSREVELRVYHATLPLRADAPSRELRPSGSTHEGPTAPLLVADHLAAIRRGDADGVVACFESDAAVRDPLGVVHRQADGGLRAYHTKRFGLGQPTGGACDVDTRGYADDGKACAIELTVTDRRNAASPPQPMLAVYERGKSGLFLALRIYEQALD